MVRMRGDTRTGVCMARRTAEGTAPKEIQRCLKVYIAREIYPLIFTDPSIAAAASCHGCVNTAMKSFFSSFRTERVDGRQVHDSGRGPSGRVRIHRALIQPKAASLDARLPLSPLQSETQSADLSTPELFGKLGTTQSERASSFGLRPGGCEPLSSGLRRRRCQRAIPPGTWPEPAAACLSCSACARLRSSRRTATAAASDPTETS